MASESFFILELIHSNLASILDPGVSILISYKEKPPVVKLPIFSEFMENTTKFMKNSKMTKWTKNLR